MQISEDNATNVFNKIKKGCIDTILIDLGDTLVHFEPRFYEPYYEELKKLGYNVTRKQVFRAIAKYLGETHFPNPDVGLPDLDFSQILYYLGIPPKTKLVKRLSEISMLSDRYYLFNDSIPFLEEVKSRGFKIGLVTNSTSKVYKIVEELQIKKYLDIIVSSYDLKLVKPHPKIFYYALSKLGSNDAIFIGDLYEVDVKGAMRAGLSPILLDREGFYDDIKNVPVYSNLLEILKWIKNS